MAAPAWITGVITGDSSEQMQSSSTSSSEDVGAKSACSSGAKPPPWRAKEEPPLQRHHFVGDKDDDGRSGSDYDNGFWMNESAQPSAAAGQSSGYDNMHGSSRDPDSDGEDPDDPFLPQFLQPAGPLGEKGPGPPDRSTHAAPGLAPGHSHFMTNGCIDAGDVSDATVAVDDQEEAYRKIASPTRSPYRRPPSPVVTLYGSPARGRSAPGDTRMRTAQPVLPLSPTKRTAVETGRETTPRRRKTNDASASPAGSSAPSMSILLAQAQHKVAATEALRQSDRDYADKVATERARVAEAREQTLRTEVARARTEALSQVRLEHDADTAAILERLRGVEQKLAEQQASSESLTTSLWEARGQARESDCQLLQARRVAEEREAHVTKVEAEVTEQVRNTMAKAERRHADTVAAFEARLAQQSRSPGCSPPCGECPKKDHRILGLESTVAGLRDIARTYEGDARKLQEALALAEQHRQAVADLRAQLEVVTQHTTGASTGFVLGDQTAMLEELQTTLDSAREDVHEEKVERLRTELSLKELSKRCSVQETLIDELRHTIAEHRAWQEPEKDADVDEDFYEDYEEAFSRYEEASPQLKFGAGTMTMPAPEQTAQPEARHPRPAPAHAPPANPLLVGQPRPAPAHAQPANHLLVGHPRPEPAHAPPAHHLFVGGCSHAQQPVLPVVRRTLDSRSGLAKDDNNTNNNNNTTRVGRHTNTPPTRTPRSGPDRPPRPHRQGDE